MTLRTGVKLFAFGALIVAIGNLLRGHDILTAVAMVLLFLFVVAKVVAALIFRPGSWSAPGDGGEPRGRPMLRPPGGRPPALSAAAEVRHEAAI